MTPYKTKDELRFLDSLYRKHEGLARINAFRDYLRVVYLRKDWGEVDPERIIYYAESCLRRALRFEDY